MGKSANLSKKGKHLLDEGYAIIDTCNRTKETKEKSALAIAMKNKAPFSVMMKSKDKIHIFARLKDNKHPASKISAIVHSVKLFYALRGMIDTLPGVYICADGFPVGDLKHYLHSFLGPQHMDKVNILSSLKPIFGKKNLADRAAHAVVKKGRAPNICLKEEHFKTLRLL